MNVFIKSALVSFAISFSAACATDDSHENQTENSSASVTLSNPGKKEITDNHVVLRIGSKEFRRDQILEDMKQIPPRLMKLIEKEGISHDELFAMLIEEKITTHLLIEEAEKAEIGKREEFIDRIKRMEDYLLVRTFLMEKIAPKNGKVLNQAAIQMEITKIADKLKEERNIERFNEDGTPAPKTSFTPHNFQVFKEIMSSAMAN